MQTHRAKGKNCIQASHELDGLEFAAEFELEDIAQDDLV